MNTDIRKLERICNGKVPNKSDIQKLIREYDEGFAVTNRQKRPQLEETHVNPVKCLWEQKGIKFPGKGILPYSCTATSNFRACNSAPGMSARDVPATVEEEHLYLELEIKESLRSFSSTSKNAEQSEISSSEPEVNDPDYGLSLLFTAAKLVGE